MYDSADPPFRNFIVLLPQYEPKLIEISYIDCTLAKIIFRPHIMYITWYNEDDNKSAVANGLLDPG